MTTSVCIRGQDRGCTDKLGRTGRDCRYWGKRDLEKTSQSVVVEEGSARKGIEWGTNIGLNK